MFQEFHGAHVHLIWAFHDIIDFGYKLYPLGLYFFPRTKNVFNVFLTKEQIKSSHTCGYVENWVQKTGQRKGKIWNPPILFVPRGITNRKSRGVSFCIIFSHSWTFLCLRITGAFGKSAGSQLHLKILVQWVWGRFQQYASLPEVPQDDFLQVVYGPCLKHCYARRPSMKGRIYLAVITQRWDRSCLQAEFPSLEKFKQKPMTYCQDVIKERRSISWVLEVADPWSLLQLLKVLDSMFLFLL